MCSFGHDGVMGDATVTAQDRCCSWHKKGFVELLLAFKGKTHKTKTQRFLVLSRTMKAATLS